MTNVKVMFGIFCLPIAQGECDTGADLQPPCTNHLLYEGVVLKEFLIATKAILKKRKV